MKAHHYLLLCGLAFSGFIVLFCFVVSLYPFKVITVKNKMSLPVTTKKVRAGTDIGIVFDYCKYINVRSYTAKSLIINNIAYPLKYGDGTNSFPTGCHSLILFHRVPSCITGDAVIHINASYPITSFRNVNYEWQTEHFTIIP